MHSLIAVVVELEYSVPLSQCSHTWQYIIVTGNILVPGLYLRPADQDLGDRN